jgi:hypothetical protein
LNGIFQNFSLFDSSSKRDQIGHYNQKPARQCMAKLRVLYLRFMFKAVSRVLGIAVILVAFVGQAITFNSFMSCETSVDPLSSHSSELLKHYAPNPIEPDSPEDCCGIECCDLDCTCIANACSSFVYFNTEVDSTNTAALSEVVYVPQFEQPKSTSTLL